MFSWYVAHVYYYYYYYYYYSDLFLPLSLGVEVIVTPDHTSDTQTHTRTRYDYIVRVFSPTQKPLPDNTQHLQKKDIHAYCEIRTPNPSKQATEEPRLSTRGHRHRLRSQMQNEIFDVQVTVRRDKFL